MTPQVTMSVRQVRRLQTRERILGFSAMSSLFGDCGVLTVTDSADTRESMLSTLVAAARGLAAR
jgi:hypothetical protein